MIRAESDTIAESRGLRAVAPRLAVKRAVSLGAACALSEAADWLERGLAEEIADVVGLAYVDGVEAFGGDQHERAAVVSERRGEVRAAVASLASDVRAGAAEQAGRAAGVELAFREICAALGLGAEYVDRWLETAAVESAVAELQARIAPTDGESEPRGPGAV